MRELKSVNDKYRTKLTRVIKSRYKCAFCVPPCGMGKDTARTSADIKRHIASKCGTPQSEANRMGIRRLNKMYAKEFKQSLC